MKRIEIQPTNLHKGNLEIKNLKKYQPFKIYFEELANDCIQVDITGKGVLNYFGQLTEDLRIEIHTNILKALKSYGEITTHDPSEIGYALTLNQLKKLNRIYNCFESEISLTIIYKKPVLGASAYSLQPTTELLSATILAEIFITND